MTISHTANFSQRSAVDTKTAFTLIELLVVISIITLLIAILLPSLAAARKSAQRIKCMSQIRQVFLGATYYATDFQNKYPVTPYVVNYGNADSSDNSSRDKVGTTGQPSPNPTGWYQFRKLDHITRKSLNCPSNTAGENNVPQDPAAATKLPFGYRYNTFNGGHELPERGQNTSLPSTYPRIENIQSSVAVLFTESATYRRPAASNTDEVYLATKAGQILAWSHEVGGNLALMDGSAHFMPNQSGTPVGTGNRYYVSWPAGGWQAPYATGVFNPSAVYAKVSYLDYYIKAQLGG